MKRPILIVDDDGATRTALRDLLEMHGYPVLVATDGVDAMQQLRAGAHPALIVLDLMMPLKNGFQFRVEQAIDPELAKIPVVISTGEVDAYPKGDVLGAVAHLTKPIDANELLAIVRAHAV